MDAHLIWESSQPAGHVGRAEPWRKDVPRLNRIVETALYVDDLDRARAFYEDKLGLAPLLKTKTLFAYDVGGSTVLLLFLRGASLKTQEAPGGTIPPHDGSGPLHIAFAIDAEELPAWEEKLARLDIAVEGRMQWEGGSTSLYFRDPDGHLLELATPGLWRTY
jgi:catechol 2,3-dioxygenase-like lactoylglutathione lyase family enzyme